ncbi:MAG: hypothetical protein AB1454_07180 [Candidatus Auribacterota bacterium]
MNDNNDITTLVNRYRNRCITHLAGIAVRLLIIAVILFVSLCVPITYLLGASGKTLILSALAPVAVIGFAAWKMCIIPYASIASLLRTARMADTLSGTFNGGLVSAFQFIHDPPYISDFKLSNELAQAHITDIARRMPQPAEVCAWFAGKHPNPSSYWLYILGVLVLPVLIFSNFYSEAFYNTYRGLFDPLPKETSFLAVRPGSVTVIKGADLTVKAVWQGTDASVPMITLNPESARQSAHPMIRTSALMYEYTIARITADMEYVVATQSVSSPRYTISTVQQPVIESHTVTYTYPEYTGWEAQSEKRAQFNDITALKGTTITITCTSALPVKEGLLLFSAPDNFIPMTINATESSVSFVLLNEDTYSVRLIDEHGQENTRVVPPRLIPQPDRPPEVHILSPEHSIEMPKEMRIHIKYSAADDIQLGSVSLHWSVEDTFTQLTLHETIAATQTEGGYDWDLTALRLSPGQTVRYFVRAEDTLPAPDGPQATDSAIHEIVFPSLAQLYQRKTEVFDSPAESISQILEQQAHMLEQLSSIEQSVRQNESLSWSDSQQLESILSNQLSMDESLRQEASQLKQQLEDLDVAQDILDTYQDIQNLLDNLLPDDLKEKLQQLQDQLRQSQDFAAIRKQLAETRMNMTEYRESLERALELLKNLSVQNKVQELYDAAAEALNNQETLDELLNAAEQDMKQLQQKAESQDKMLNTLDQGMDSLAEDTESLNEDIAAEIEALRQWLKDENMLETLQKMMQEHQSGNTSSSRARSGKLKQSLSSLQDSLKDMLRQMKRKSYLLNKIVESITRILRLSNELDDVALALNQNQGKNSAENIQQAKKLYYIQQELKRISLTGKEIASELTFIEPDMYTRLNTISQELESQNEKVFKRGDRNAVAVIVLARANLNTVAGDWVALLETLSKMQMQGEGGGMPQPDLQNFFDQLNAMANQQEGLNQKTENMLGSPMAMTAQQYMTQLAAEQKMLADAMAKLTESVKGQNRVLGSLNDLPGAMKDISGQIRNGQVTPELINRQQQIHTRMLEAEKSLRTREKSKERKSDTAKQPFQGRDINELDLEQPLQDRIQRLDRAIVPYDYRDLVDNYFMLLKKER